MNTPDFLIVGAGIFGITTAIELRKQNYSVAILNPDSIPHSLAASTDISKIVRMEYGADLQYMEMANTSIDGWKAWNDLFKDTLYHEVGFLLLCQKSMETDGQSFEWNSYQSLLKKGFQPQRLDEKLITEKYPVFAKGKFTDGFFHSKAGFVEASRAVEKLTDYARELGVQISEGKKVKELLQENKKVIGVKTEEGEIFQAGHVIVCAGPNTPYLVPDLMPMMKGTGHPVFHVQPSKPDLFSMKKLPVFSTDISNTGWYGFPLHPKEGVIKIANHGKGLELHPDKDERIVYEKDIQKFKKYLTSTIPSLENDPIVFTRRCVYTDTLDGHFWIDQHPEISNLTIGTGGSGHGLKMGVEIRLMATYLTAPSSCILFPPSTSSANEEINITSNQTYRLNRSPVTNAPTTPAISICKKV